MKKLVLSSMILMLIASLALSACSPATPPSPTSTPSPSVGGLGGTSWRLTSYGPTNAQQPAAPDVEAEITFSMDGEVSGNLGCNGFGGDYSADGQKITFGTIISTMMVCEEPRMTQETTAFQVMKGTVNYTIAGQAGDILIITDASDTTLTFAQTSSP